VLAVGFHDLYHPTSCSVFARSWRRASSRADRVEAVPSDRMTPADRSGRRIELSRISGKGEA
jgi:hypothetical protein